MPYPQTVKEPRFSVLKTGVLYIRDFLPQGCWYNAILISLPGLCLAATERFHAPGGGALLLVLKSQMTKHRCKIEIDDRCTNENRKDRDRRLCPAFLFQYFPEKLICQDADDAAAGV